ncbi:hypothetical protein, partial [Pseudomonas fluorescens]|uniref:hypothetical protein n=1 Tax=Pseudomonas fluorescens TaxID=294 RepID=UPI001A7EC5BA
LRKQLGFCFACEKVLIGGTNVRPSFWPSRTTTWEITPKVAAQFLVWCSSFFNGLMSRAGNGV